MRLTGGGLNWGRLEISHAGQFGSVCGRRSIEDFDQNSATVACKQLGFEVLSRLFHTEKLLLKFDYMI